MGQWAACCSHGTSASKCARSLQQKFGHHGTIEGQAFKSIPSDGDLQRKLWQCSFEANDVLTAQGNHGVTNRRTGITEYKSTDFRGTKQRARKEIAPTRSGQTFNSTHINLYPPYLLSRHRMTSSPSRCRSLRPIPAQEGRVYACYFLSIREDSFGLGNLD